MTKAGNSQIMRTITLLITIFSLSLPAYAQYSGGTGEPNDPYQIATAEDLMLLGETPEDYDKHFILIADIDLDPNLPGRRVFDRAVIAPDVNDTINEWGRGSYDGTIFTGSFDGQGHKIQQLHIEGVSYLGLFGFLDYGVITDLGLEAVDVNGTGEYVGGLVGYCWGSISNSYSAGTVTGKSYVGGLLGYNDFGNSSSISGSYSTSTVTGNSRVGGLVGGSSFGSISNSYSTGTVTGGVGYWVGGLVGYNDCSISNSYSTSTVTGDTRVGGLVGSNGWGSISNSHSTGTVTGNSRVGGLVGYNDSSISNSYSTGTVTGNSSDWVGGLVGVNDHGSISNSYSTGTVIGEVGVGVGGLVGYSYNNSISNSFWDTQTSGLSESYGGKGLSTTEMQTATTFLNAGWDFINETDNGTDGIWKIGEGHTYPLLSWQILSWEKYGGGTGEPNDPYLIYTAEHLNAIGAEPNDWDKHFKLMADIDLSGYTYERAVIAPDIGGNGHTFPGTSFTGVFGGNEHEVSHLTITGKSYLGLFGQVGPGGQVKGLGVVDVNITGSYYAIGGLVGDNLGNIAVSYSTGTVTGYTFVGGLVGYNNYGDVSASYSTCAASAVSSGNQAVGGLVGVSAGSITTSYSSGDVSGQRSIGGLVGWSYQSNITNSYSTGTVSGDQNIGGLVGKREQDGGIVADCFWDTQTSGQATSAGGTGKATAEMQTENTFTDAGWDFVDETDNGTEDIWKMWDGYDCPRLQCEPGPNTPLVFVDINDPGFYGQMSKYEVTNTQYCDFLNATLASGDITVNGTDVEGASGSNSGADYVGQRYYRGDGPGWTGWTGAGAINGGASRIHYNEGAFIVDSGFGNHPVTYVSWYGAMAFANYYGYYLPTEDQWRAVADYDGTYIYGCGQIIDPGIANYRDSEHPDGTTSVGSFGQYGYGMSDMAGNVWEWTSSSLDSSHIFRGGSLGSTDSDCDISIRGDGIPYANYYDIGFRVCR